MQTVRELLGARELLRTFVARDLQVRYKGSALGIIWSLLNPALMMAVYTVVFSSIMRERHRRTSRSSSWRGSCRGRSSRRRCRSARSRCSRTPRLLQKVYFPREVLPISMTLANLVNFGIAFCAFLPFAI